MIDLLRENPLLLLFLVAAIGYPLGRIKVGEASLGVAAVLFVGLAFGALDPNLKLPEPFGQLGLALFVYMVGLSSGPGFLRSFKGRGLRDSLFALGILVLAMGLVLVPHLILGLRPGQTAGLYAGVLTNTPAMAAVVEYLKQHGESALFASDPVVSYSIAYPVSVLGMILTIYLMQRLWRVDYAVEAQQLRGMPGVAEPITNITIRVTQPDAIGRTIPDLVAQHGWKVIFGRVKRADHADVAGQQTRLQSRDLVTAVGTPEELAGVIATLGHVSADLVDMDRSEVDTRRIFVSDPRVAGLRIRDLHLPRRFSAVITRVRRGDIEWLPHADLTLELGDRVRVLARRESLADVARFFGDSYKALSEVDISSLGFGLVLGLLLGLVPIPLPGGLTIKLGLAGGPLIVALALGALARTGRVVWTMPYSANLLFRQFGLILFVAGVGTRSGYDFAQTLLSSNGLTLVIASAVTVAAIGLMTLFIGHRLLKIPMGLLVGMMAGIQTQAAVLGFVQEQTKNELPNVGYATIYPLATVAKIVLAQVLIMLLL